MVGETLNSPKVIDDLVKWETDSAFCRDGVTNGIENLSGVTIPENTDPVGLPLKAGTAAGDYSFVEVGEEASTIALIIQGPKIPETLNAAFTDTQQEYVVLKLGPALINADAIAVNDVDGTGTYTQATILTALAALNIEVFSEPTEIEEQTT